MTNLDSAAPCPVCGNALSVRMAYGRKTGKQFLSLVCPIDGRHFRGFIADRDYLERVAEHLNAKG